MHLPNILMKHVWLTKSLQSWKTQQTNRDFDDVCGFFFPSKFGMNQCEPITTKQELTVSEDRYQILEKNLNQITQGRELFLDWVSQQGFCQKLRS